MKQWEITKTNYTISDLVNYQQTGTLELNPSFQRRSVWNAAAKSYLIDTVVRGLPVPILIMRERRTNLKDLKMIREVVDGQQRIRTIISYIKPDLLSDFNPSNDIFTVKKVHNEEIAGLTFSQIDEKIQHRILGYQFSVHVLPAQVEDREVLEIFERINSTGLRLKDQELRNASYFGDFKTIMYRLAGEQLNRWRDWKIFEDHEISRMEEVELTSELAILMLRGVTQKQATTINRYYREYDQEFPDMVEIERRFRSIMDTIDEIFGHDFTIMPKKEFRLRQKVVFYDFFAFIYDLRFGIGSKLTHVKPKQISNDIIHHIREVANKLDHKTAPDDVISSVYSRTTNADARNITINYLRKECSS